MEIDVQADNSKMKIILDGKLVFSVVPDVREKVNAEIQKLGPKLIIIDLEKVGFIDSAGIGFLISLYRNGMTNNSSVALLKPIEIVEKSLKMIGASRLFTIYSSEDEIPDREE